MRPLDLLSLKLFITVCETRNMAQAAERECIVSSAVSKRLSQLEAAVGVRLLTRRHHGVLPTLAGEALLEHAREMILSMSRIERDMAAFASGIKGQVRILASASAMAESLADDVALFLSESAHVDILIDIEERVSSQVVRGVRDGVAAIVICWDKADMVGLETQPYRCDRMSVVVHESHPFAERIKVATESIFDYSHVGLQSSTAVQEYLVRAATLAGKRFVQRMTVSTFDAALKVVSANLAVCVMPYEVAMGNGQRSKLRVIPLSDDWAKRQFAICHRDEASLSAPARAVVDFLIDRAAISRISDDRE